MPDETRNSDLILRQAGQSLAHQRAGGRRTGSIGRRAAALKREHALRKLLRVGLASGAILFAATVAGLVIDGIGWTGIIVTLLALIAATAVFASFPRLGVPSRESLAGGTVKSLVGRTQLWLESQRAALPAPAVQLVDQIGLQLDALGVQLDGLDEALPATREVRQLVGTHLPELVATYASIPRHLRGEPQAGRSPDQQLAESLGKISAEIDSVTRQLAAGAIDDLAIKTRYLDYKYGEALNEPEKAP
ncbi:MAG: hypothetical protein RLZZ84_2240 [Pseudomonadota bacterium]